MDAKTVFDGLEIDPEAGVPTILVEDPEWRVSDAAITVQAERVIAEMTVLAGMTQMHGLKFKQRVAKHAQGQLAKARKESAADRERKARADQRRREVDLEHARRRAEEEAAANRAMIHPTNARGNIVLRG